MTTLDELNEAMKALKSTMQPDTKLSAVMEAWTRAVDAHVKLMCEQDNSREKTEFGLPIDITFEIPSSVWPKKPD